MFQTQSGLSDLPLLTRCQHLATVPLDVALLAISGCHRLRRAHCVPFRIQPEVDQHRRWYATGTDARSLDPPTSRGCRADLNVRVFAARDAPPEPVPHVLLHDAGPNSAKAITYPSPTLRVCRVTRPELSAFPSMLTNSSPFTDSTMPTWLTY
jgi:hypothetical protein